MKFIYLLKLMSGVIDLEQKAVLRSDVNSFDLRALLKRVGVIVEILEI